MYVDYEHLLVKFSCSSSKVERTLSSNSNGQSFLLNPSIARYALLLAFYFLKIRGMSRRFPASTMFAINVLSNLWMVPSLLLGKGISRSKITILLTNWICVNGIWSWGSYVMSTGPWHDCFTFRCRWNGFTGPGKTHMHIWISGNGCTVPLSNSDMSGLPTSLSSCASCTKSLPYQ